MTTFVSTNFTPPDKYGRTSVLFLTILRRFNKSLAKLSIPAFDRLNANLESYPKVIILDPGIA